MRGTPAILVLLWGVGVSLGEQWQRPDAPLDKLYDLFFFEMASARPCVATANTTHPSGCSTASDEIGALFLVDTQQALKDLISSEKDYIAVINLPQDEVSLALGELRGVTTVKGIILTYFNSKTMPKAFSSLEKQPNLAYDLYQGKGPVWNPDGDGTIHSLFRPMLLLVSSNDFSTALEKARQNRDNGYSLPMHYGQINYPMSAHGLSSAHCLHGKVRECDPIGKSSVWTSLRPVSAFNNDTRYIAVTLPMSSTSLFHEFYAPGAGAVVGSLITALATIDALAIHRQELKTEILFMFMATDEYDGHGSQRFVNDLESFHCRNESAEWPYCRNPFYKDLNFTKLRLQNFDHIIALDQLALVERESNSNSPMLYVHYDQESWDSGDATKKLVNTLVSNNALKNTTQGYTGFLPPSSLHHFLPKLTRSTVGTAVLASYPGRYTNRFAGSIYDTADLGSDSPRINPNRIVDAAETLGKTLLELSGSPNSSNLTVDGKLVVDLLKCLGHSMNCDLVNTYVHQDWMCTQCTLNTYQGITGNWSHSILGKFIFSFLRDKLRTGEGDECMKNERDPCPEGYECIGLNASSKAGRCVAGPTYYHHSYSPILECVDVGSNGMCNQWNFTTYNGSAWTESVWTVAPWGMRLYTKDSVTHEWLILFSGVATTVLSFVAMWIFKKSVIPKLKAD